MKDAKYHYELSLQRTYILGTFRKLIKIRDDKNSKADKLRLKNQKKRFLKQLRTATQIQAFEDEQDVNQMSKTAYAFYEFSMYTKTLRTLKTNIKENKMDAQFYRKKVYHKYLLRRVFRIWIKLQGYIKQENQILGTHQDRVVARFRSVQLTRKVFNSLNDHCQETKISREKDLYKN